MGFGAVTVSGTRGSLARGQQGHLQRRAAQTSVNKQHQPTLENLTPVCDYFVGDPRSNRTGLQSFPGISAEKRPPPCNHFGGTGSDPSANNSGFSH